MPVSRPAAAAELSKRTRPAVTPLQGAACGAQWQKCNPPGGGAAEVSSRCRLAHSPGLSAPFRLRLSSNHRPRPEAPAAGRWGGSYPAGGKVQSCGKKGQSLREKSSNPAGKKFQPCGKKLAAELPSRRPLRSFPRKNLSPIISWIVISYNDALNSLSLNAAD
jgi:hypothetical protein